MVVVKGYHGRSKTSGMFGGKDRKFHRRRRHSVLGAVAGVGPSRIGGESIRVLGAPRRGSGEGDGPWGLGAGAAPGKGPWRLSRPAAHPRRRA